MKTRRIAEPFFLIWGVHPSGYKWEQKEDRDNPGAPWHLVPCDPGELPRTYEPLKQSTGLFRTFADVLPTRKSILKFANEYGMLGFSTLPRQMPYLNTESLSQWEDELFRMKPLVALWQALRQRDNDRLAKILLWKDGALLYARDEWVFGPGPSARLLPAKWVVVLPAERVPQSGLKPGDLIGAGWNVLADQLNHQIMVHPTSPGLMWTPDKILWLYMRPHHLAAAMWLQFASAVSENRSLQSCEVCGRWFHVGRDGDRRTDARFCSNACRQSKYRENVEKRKSGAKPKSRREKGKKR